MTRRERLEKILVKYEDEERKRRLEGRVRESDVLKNAILRTKAELEKENGS